MKRTCAHCQNPDQLDYGVADACWEEVVPEELQPEVVCLICFDGFAAKADVTWSLDIVYVKFAGDAGTFTWYP